MAFMRVAEEGSFEPVEVPCEEDGTVLLSTIAAQFAGTIGLKYRNVVTNHLRGVRLSDGRLYPPEDGWGSRVFSVVVSRTSASKAAAEQRASNESRPISAKQCPTDSQSTDNDSESLCQREIANALKHIDHVGDPFVEYAAGILHAIACDSDTHKRATLAAMRVTASLTRCAVRMNRLETLVSLLRPLSVLTAHSNENKRQLLDTDGSLDLLIESLKLCRVADDSPQFAMSSSAMVTSASSVDRMVGELAGVVLRNVSSVVALDESLRARLRASGCFELLLTHLRASSLRVVANAAGTLWNLTAKHAADQQRFVDLGARGVLRSLTASRHRAIAAASRAALKNLANVGGSRMVKPVSDSSSMFFRPNSNDNFIFSSPVGGGDGHVGVANVATEYESGSLLRLRRARDEQVEKERALQMAETCDHLDDGTASASASESASASDGDTEEPELERSALIEIESAVRNRLSRKTTSSNVNPVVSQAVSLMHNCMVDDDTEAESETAQKGDSRYVTQLNVMNDAVGNRVVVFDDEAEPETETEAEGASESDEQLAPTATCFRFPLAPLPFPAFTSDPNTNAAADAAAFAEGDLLTRALGDLEVDSADGGDGENDEIEQAAIDACIASASAPATLKRNTVSSLFSARTPTQYSARTPTESCSMWTNDSDRIMAKSFLKSPTEPDVGFAMACNSRRCSSYKIELRVGLNRNAEDVDSQADGDAERLASPSGDLVRVFTTEDSSDVSSDCLTHNSAGVGASPLVRNGTFSIRRDCVQCTSTTMAAPSGVAIAVATGFEIESATTPDIIREHSFGKASPDSNASSSNANVVLVSTPMPMQRRATVTVLSELEDVAAMQLMPSTDNLNNDSPVSSRSPSLISLSQSLPDEAASPTLPAPVTLPINKCPEKQTQPLNRANPRLNKANANRSNNSNATPRNDARATPTINRKLPVATRPREVDRPQTAAARTVTQKPAPTNIRTERAARNVPPKPTSTTNLAMKSKTLGPNKLQPSTSASADMKRVVGATAIAKPVPAKRPPAKPTSAKVAGRVAAKPLAPGARESRPSTATTASNPAIASSVAANCLSTFQAEQDSLRARPNSRRGDRPYQRIPTSMAQIQRLEAAAERKIVSSFECVPIDLDMPIELTSSLSSSSDSLDISHSRFSKPCTPNLPTSSVAVKRPSLSQVNTSIPSSKSKFLKSPSASTTTLKSPSTPIPRTVPPSNARRPPPPPPRSIGVKSPPTTKRVTIGNKGIKPAESATVQTPLQLIADCSLPSPSDRAATCPSSPTVATAPSNVLIPSNALSTDNQLFQFALVQIDTDTPQSTKLDHDDVSKSKGEKVPNEQPERPPSSTKRVSVVDRLAAFFKPKSTNRSSPNKSNTSAAREQSTHSATPLVPPPMINRSTSQPTDRDQLASVTPETTTLHSRSSTMPFSGNSDLRQLSTPDSMPIADLWITREGVCNPDSATVTVTVAASAVQTHSEVDSVNLIDKGHTGSLRSTPTSKQLGAVRRAGTTSRATRSRPPLRDVISGETIFSHSQQRPDVLPIGESGESQLSVVAKGGGHSQITTG